MSVPWKELGLPRFLVVDSNGSLLFENGQPHPELTVDSSEGLPQVTYTPGGVGEAVIELHLLARTLLPTLSEHTLKSLCAHNGICLEEGGEKEAIGHLFAALIDGQDLPLSRPVQLSELLDAFLEHRLVDD